MPSKSQAAKTDAAIIEQLERLAGSKAGTEESLVFQGGAFVMPSIYQDDLKGAIKQLSAIYQAREENQVFTRSFDYRYDDGVVALNRVIRKAFGIDPIGHGSFFTGPPRQRDIPVAFGEMMTCVEGEMVMPLMAGGYLNTEKDANGNFILYAYCPKKAAKRLEGLYMLVEAELRDNSIYRGKAVTDTFDFVDTSGINPDRVHYSDSVMRALDANIWTPIKHASVVTRLGHSLKRSILLHGPYGTGKTLAGMLTSLVAGDNGWTSILSRPGMDRNTLATLEAARLYAPSVVFIEDVDTMAGAGGVDATELSRLLDAFDGMGSKDKPVMIVLTTNHADKIHKGMLRPGRLDAIIEIAYPDKPAIKRMLATSIPAANRSDDFDDDMAVNALVGFVPAFVGEAAKRATLYATARVNPRDGIAGDSVIPNAVSHEDVILAAKELRQHEALMADASDETRDDTLASAMVNVVKDAITNMAVDARGAFGTTMDLVETDVDGKVID